MPELAINGRFLARTPTGVDRFAREILRALDTLVDEGDPTVRNVSLSLLAPRGTEPLPGLRHIRFERVGWLQGHAWEQFELPLALRGRRLLNLCNTAPLVVRRQAVVIHDAATARVPQAFTRAFRIAYALAMPLLGRRAERVLTVSDFSRGELQACWGIDRARVAVVPEGAEHLLREAGSGDVLQRHGLTRRGYVLAVGSRAPHKNFATLLQAGSLPGAGRPVEIAVAGGANARVFRESGQPMPNGVRWLGRVTDTELRTLYGSALAFVFPSRYEGFGLPPLEAMACGCPVIASYAASMPEVCGDAALYFDCEDPRSLRAALDRVVGDGPLRARLREAGLRRAAGFTWARAARELALQVNQPAVMPTQMPVPVPVSTTRAPAQVVPSAQVGDDDPAPAARAPAAVAP